ncbi:MAG: hypothetical protein RR617_07840 [Anaerovoracaceae bacterium]
MQIKFYFFEDMSLGSPILIPSCNIKDSDINIVNCLSGILMDDGGCSKETTLLSLKDGVDKLINSQNKINTWVRESWMAESNNDIVKISFLYDEEYFVNINYDAFKSILLTWVDFYSSTPSLDNIIYLEY